MAETAEHYTRNSMYGLYQNMLHSTKTDGSSNGGLMQNVYQQVHDILNNDESSLKYPENVIKNPYGFNEYIDSDMIIKMKTLFDNLCKDIEKQHNISSSTKQQTPSKPGKSTKYKLDIKYLNDILQLFGFSLSDEEINTLQTTIKNLYSTQITFEELFQIMVTEIDPTKDDEIIKNAFRTCDIDKTNRLTVDELKQMLNNLNVTKYNDGQIRHLLHFINGDKNRDFLSLYDFRKMMTMDVKLFETKDFKYKTSPKKHLKFIPPTSPKIKRTTTPYRYSKPYRKMNISSMPQSAKSHIYQRNNRNHRNQISRTRPSTAVTRDIRPKLAAISRLTKSRKRPNTVRSINEKPPKLQRFMSQ